MKCVCAYGYISRMSDGLAREIVRDVKGAHYVPKNVFRAARNWGRAMKKWMGVLWYTEF